MRSTHTLFLLPLFLLSTLFALVGCGGTSATGAASHELTVADNGKTIQVHLEDIIRISLTEDQASGVKWTIADQAGILTSTGSQFIPSATPDPAAPGTHLFSFRATKVGTGKIDLSLVSTTDSSMTPSQTFAVTIHIV